MMLYTDLNSSYIQNSTQNQQCLIPPYHQNFYDVLVKTIAATQQQSMNTNQIEINNEPKTQEPELSSKEKRSTYMSQLRGSVDSEYRRMERVNNARAMRKKRSENPLYREHERRQNRAHMAEKRRDNPEYRQSEHTKNRHRMALKRCLPSQTSSNNNHTIDRDPTSKNDNVINSIYQTLENNLQSSHISFIPYQSSSLLRSNFDHHQRRSKNNKRRNEYEFLQQIDEYCRHQDTGSNSDSNSRSAASTSSC